MTNRVILYLLVITMPVAACFAVFQSIRFSTLRSEVRELNTRQQEWIEENKRLITDIAELSSPERIERIATSDLGLVEKKPEDVLQVHIDQGRLR